jgi:hypothetical protein
MYDVHLLFFGSGSGDASLCRTRPLLLRSHFGSMCCTAGYRTPRWSAVLRSMVLIVFSCMLGPMTNVLACIGLAAVIIMLHRRCSPAAARSPASPQLQPRRSPQPAARRRSPAAAAPPQPAVAAPLQPAAAAPPQPAAAAPLQPAAAAPPQPAAATPASARRRSTTGPAAAAPPQPVVGDMMLTFFSTSGQKTLHSNPECKSIRYREPHQVIIGASFASNIAKCKLCCV